MTTKRTLPVSMSSDRAAPAYLFHMNRLMDNVRKLDQAFRSRYQNFQIAYSFKTNYLQQIICQLVQFGCFAEVVSPYELRYAIDPGECNVPCSKVIYNGVIPDPKGKYQVAREGGIVNIDNLTEYRQLSEIARLNKTIIVLGIRVNFDFGNGLVSRFGFDVEGKDLSLVLEEMKKDPFVIFGGFHCHIGTARPAAYWEKKAGMLAQLALAHGAKYVDLGGGMYGPMIPELASQFPDYAPSFDDYADPVCSIFKELFPAENLRLIIEPGTALVGNTFDLIAHVTDIKHVRGHDYITVDTCSNHLGMICECRKIPVTNQHDAEGTRTYVKDAIIAGCTCLEFDYIRKEYAGSVAIGDTLIFENVGAYSLSAARQFIVPRIGVIDAESGACLRIGDSFFNMFR